MGCRGQGGDWPEYSSDGNTEYKQIKELAHKVISDLPKEMIFKKINSHPECISL